MKFPVSFFAFFIAISCCRAQQPMPHVLTVNPAQLASLKASYASGERSLFAEKILKGAEKALQLEPLSVTMKDRAPEGGSIHDYVSLAPYWWPDPSKKDGLPYIRRDGEVNPERERYHDREHFTTLLTSLGALGAAYYVTTDERFARHASMLVSAWFLDTSTAMNPSLNFAQAIRGRNEGRGAGLIEMHMLPRVLDAVGLIQGSNAWTVDKQKAMEEWCRRYYAWLTTSAIGLDELDAPNNHGSWYDVQRASLLAFMGRRDEARAILEEAKTKRIASEIEPDGTQPRELIRTKSMGYSTFNLLALTTLATVGSTVGVDLWHYATPDNRGIKQAIDYMVPFYAGEKKWERQQIVEFDTNEAVEMLKKASPYYGGAYDALIAQLEKKTGGKKK